MTYSINELNSPQLPVKSTLLFFFANCNTLGVKIIRIDPLEPNIWLYYVYYAVLQLFFKPKVWSLANSKRHLFFMKHAGALLVHPLTRPAHTRCEPLAYKSRSSNGETLLRRTHTLLILSCPQFFRRLRRHLSLASLGRLPLLVFRQ